MKEKKRNIPLDIKILEASNRVGGVIQTEHRDGFVIEHGPDAFISTKPWAKTLCEEIGIEEHFIGTNPKVRTRLRRTEQKTHSCTRRVLHDGSRLFPTFYKKRQYSV